MKKLKGKLFLRMFSAIFAVVIASVILFTGCLISNEYKHIQATYETEVFTQARQVAEYMQELSGLSSVRKNATLQHLINTKVKDINSLYDADIWLVSFSSGRVQYVDSSWNTGAELSNTAVLEQLYLIRDGQDIRVSGLFPDLGDQIVTLGVPWTNNGQVVGAVLLHIPNDRFNISFFSVFKQVLPIAAAAILVGLLFAIVITRGQLKPIHEIDKAVREFSTGDLSRRVELNCGGELQELGSSINRMAEELSNLEDSRRSFVSNVSHELRSPMTSIKGYIEAILDGTIPAEDRKRYLGVVLDETNRLTALVHDLLDLSRLESGKFPMNPVPFNANEMMLRSLVRFEQRINEKNIDVDIQFADDPCYVTGDINRLDQVVSNFVDNAVKFMTGENSKLTMRTVVEGKNVRLCVEDNGPGIDPKDLPHIQERFYKADKAHTAGMGTGLGLSISKSILQQHHSQMEVTSQPGKTVFSFVLAAAEPPAKALPSSGALIEPAQKEIQTA